MSQLTLTGPVSCLLPHTSGVYTLRLHGFAVYIGQSADLAQRLKTHQRTVLHDAVIIERCPPGELDALEGERIHAAHPPLNRLCPLHCGFYGDYRGRRQLGRLGIVPVACMARYGFRAASYDQAG
jgi:hypothetical protein